MKLHKLLLAHWTKNEIFALQAALQTAQRVWKTQAAQKRLSPSLQRVYSFYALVLARLLGAITQELKARSAQERLNPKPADYHRP